MPPMVSGFLDAPGTVRELALAHRTAVSLAVSSRENLSIVLREDRRAMPRQRTDHSRIVYVFPDDFPQRLVRFREVSRMPWAEIARRLGADPETVGRWHKDGVRPNAHYLLALQDLAEGRGLGHLFTVRATPAYQTAESEGRGESGARPSPSL